MPSNPVLELRNVRRVYHQGEIEVRALNGVTLDVMQGEFLAIAGPSGSGKTTLLNVCGGLDQPDEGAVVLEGRDLADLSRSALARLRLERIGFVFQAYNLVPVLTAEENAEFILLLRGVARDERRARVRTILAEVGLDGLETRRPSQLSGGQQQRVAVARAIVGRPALVLADEPTANLDSEAAKKLLDLMARLNRDHGTTFVFSTHDPRVIARARRVVRLRDGEVESDEIRDDDP